MARICHWAKTKGLTAESRGVVPGQEVETPSPPARVLHDELH